MFDAPMDGLVLWVGLAVISLAVAGIALSLPTESAPDASGLASTIDGVATSEHRVTATLRPEATEIRLRVAQVSLRSAAGTAHGRLVVADPVPAWNGSLRAVLDGREPSVVFESKRAFRRALQRGRERAGAWRAVPTRLRIRRAGWGEVDGTLVG